MLTVKAWWKDHVPPRFNAARMTDLGTHEATLRRWLVDPAAWSLFLHGDAGTGKTYSAYALSGAYFLRVLPERPWPPRFESVPHLVVKLQREAVKDDIADTTYEHLRGHDGILVLDDLGAEKTTEFVAQQLYSILNEREAYYRKTVITSNLNLQQVAERFSDRIASRLSSGLVLECTGNDRRMQPQSEGE